MNLKEIMDATPEKQSRIKEELLQMSQDQVNAAISIIENVELKEALKQSAEDYKALTESTKNTVSTAMDEMRNENQAQNRIMQAEISRLKTSNQILEQGMNEKLAGFTAKMTSLCNGQQKQFEQMAAKMERSSDRYVAKVEEDIRKAHAENTRYWRTRAKRNVWTSLYLAFAPAIMLFASLVLLLQYFG